MGRRSRWDWARSPRPGFCRKDGDNVVADDEVVSLFYHVSIKTARLWIYIRWLLVTGRLVGDGAVAS